MAASRKLGKYPSRRHSVLALAGALMILASAATATEPVDLEIVIASDVSSSIDERESALQRQGVAAALRSREVIGAIRSGGLGRIAVAYVDWSSDPFNRVIVDWQVIHDQASADAFAEALLRAPRTYGRGTAIGGAMRLAARMIEANNFDGTRRVIDISGDGPNNRGRWLPDVRDEVVARGITINGLPIITGDYGTGDWGDYYLQLDKYYDAYVIGGAGAFSLPAYGFEEFATAIRRKLILEISGEPPASRQAHHSRSLRLAAPRDAGEARGKWTSD